MKMPSYFNILLTSEKNQSDSIKGATSIHKTQSTEESFTGKCLTLLSNKINRIAGSLLCNIFNGKEFVSSTITRYPFL